jgi:predicted LPLAT superfamily acyltransferase
LGRLAGARHASFAAADRLDRRAHRALGDKVAAVSDHPVFRNQRTRSAACILRILETRARPACPLVACLPPFLLFAATILDRLYLLRGEFEHFDVTLHEKEILLQKIESGNGCILLGSHLGSFEVLRALGITQQNFPLKVLMDTSHNQNITRFLDALNKKIAETVIVPDRPDTLLRVKESLDTGFLVGMLADRVSSDDKTTQCQFLDAPVIFPAGPILLAAIMHCPVILFFGLYRGGKRYEIYFEHFAEEITLDRDRRTEDVQHWMQRYAERLEHYARLAPYNWFNFYSLWD